MGEARHESTATLPPPPPPPTPPPPPPPPPSQRDRDRQTDRQSVLNSSATHHNHHTLLHTFSKSHLTIFLLFNYLKHIGFREPRTSSLIRIRQGFPRTQHPRREGSFTLITTPGRSASRPRFPSAKLTMNTVDPANLPSQPSCRALQAVQYSPQLSRCMARQVVNVRCGPLPPPPPTPALTHPRPSSAYLPPTHSPPGFMP
ncbi:hypothetical protein E2C01_085951 [Portunus trituberculatus]|uniref:Uncharacterized protein n=1 Tax=Portunus trituberculatus TaxID=210409 RepID=A0A5B7JC52_PORTR|nr:hypothetical protein [Portunus trituberculatus]